MITVHHLNASRSMRALWLLEELGLDYEIVRYQRDPQTGFGPPEMRSVSPLGKSPTIEEDGSLIFESGAIVEYLIGAHDTTGTLALEPSDPEYYDYVRWLHYAEASAMIPVILALYAGRLGDAAAPIRPRIASEVSNHFGFVSRHLEDREFFVADRLTGADVMMLSPLEFAVSMRLLDNPQTEGEYDALKGYLDAIHARPAYRRALERSGESA